MTILKQELKRGKLSLLIWTLSIGFMVLICMMMFPEMKGKTDSVSDMFSSMGSFTAAFGMDKISLGEIMGFYGIECGNILGLGGAFFAGLLGISALANEEKNHTAEFLLTHPSSVSLRFISPATVTARASNVPAKHRHRNALIRSA